VFQNLSGVVGDEEKCQSDKTRNWENEVAVGARECMAKVGAKLGAWALCFLILLCVPEFVLLCW
jgi:hypothetical protein